MFFLHMRYHYESLFFCVCYTAVKKKNANIQKNEAKANDLSFESKNKKKIKQYGIALK